MSDLYKSGIKNKIMAGVEGETGVGGGGNWKWACDVGLRVKWGGDRR